MKWMRSHKVISCITAAFIIAAGIFAFHCVREDGLGTFGGAVAEAAAKGGGKVTESAEGIKGFFRGIFSYRSLKEENEALAAENEELRRELARARLSDEELDEMKDLSRALGYGAVKKGRVVSGNIVSLDRSLWMTGFNLDVGTADGVNADDPVLSGNGLTGRVADVGRHWAKVVTLTEDGAKTSFRIEGKKKTLGILSGDGRGKLEGYVFNPDADINKGDRVISSGVGLYPAGLDVGTVSEAEYNEKTQLLTVTVEPAVDPGDLTKAAVMI